MQVIHKYTLPNWAPAILKISIPVEHKILSCAEQNGTPVVYVMYNKEHLVKELQNVEFEIIGTGHDINYVENLTFLGTVNLDDGRLMFHILYRYVKC